MIKRVAFGELQVAFALGKLQVNLLVLGAVTSSPSVYRGGAGIQSLTQGKQPVTCRGQMQPVTRRRRLKITNLKFLNHRRRLKFHPE